MRVLRTILGLSLLTLPALAQGEAPDLAEKAAAMAKLEFLVGEWRGSSWVQMGPQRSDATGVESVQKKAGGLALLIEGRFTSRFPDGSERVTHDALGVLSYDSASGAYRLATHLANGRTGDFTARLIGDQTIQWVIPETPVGEIRYTLAIDGDTWHETGHMSREGEPFQFFEMSLKRVGAAPDEDAASPNPAPGASPTAVPAGSATGSSTGGKASPQQGKRGCSIECPEGDGAKAATVTCLPGFRAVCNCEDLERIAYCEPEHETPGGG